jgi:hypothetical protein
MGLGKNCGGQKNRSLFVAINSGVVAGLLLLILLNFVAGTPRARLNVIQIVSTLFFLAVILRQIIGGRSAEGESHPKAPSSRGSSRSECDDAARVCSSHSSRWACFTT